MNPERRDPLPSLRAKGVAWAVIALALAAFWGCVWFGIGQPLLDAWLNH